MNMDSHTLGDGENHKHLVLGLMWQIIAVSYLRDHPFKTSAFFRGGGVKNWPNLPTDNSKKLPTGGGRGQKS